MNRRQSTTMRRRAVITTVIALLAVIASFGQTALAAPVDDAIVDLQHDWEVIRYRSPVAERDKQFEALAAKAHRVTEIHAGRPEPLIWEGIILSSWAAERGGLAALGLVKQAKTLYEAAIAIDGSALDGSAYGSLGALYYKVPGWPIGFGDKAKAKELLQRALTLNPRGIDANFFYGEYLFEAKQKDQAIDYLTRALAAPARPGRQLADDGRREEARALLERARGK